MKNDLTLAVFGKRKLNSTGTLSDHIKMLNDLNLINIGELAEQAISKTSNISRCDPCNEGYDLVNGVEIKHGQTHARSIRGNTLRAWVSIKNKTGPIFAVITETITSKQYFFRFPKSYYKDFNANAICIPFEITGKPRRFQQRASGFISPWYYEIDNYAKLCELAKKRGPICLICFVVAQPKILLKKQRKSTLCLHPNL